MWIRVMMLLFLGGGLHAMEKNPVQLLGPSSPGHFRNKSWDDTLKARQGTVPHHKRNVSIEEVCSLSVQSPSPIPQTIMIAHDLYVQISELRDQVSALKTKDDEHTEKFSAYAEHLSEQYRQILAQQEELTDVYMRLNKQHEELNKQHEELTKWRHLYLAVLNKQKTNNEEIGDLKNLEKINRLEILELKQHRSRRKHSKRSDHNEPRLNQSDNVVILNTYGDADE